MQPEVGPASTSRLGARLGLLVLLVAVGLGALDLSAFGAPRSAAAVRVRLDGGDLALLTREQEIFLDTLPRRGEGLLAFSRRLCGSERAQEAVAAANGGKRKLLSGTRYRVPLAALKGEQRLRVLRALFPDDRSDAGGWRHKVRRFKSVPAPTLRDLASWFTDNPDSARALARHNERDPQKPLVAGDWWMIPSELLAPGLRGVVVGGKPAEPPKVAEAPRAAKPAPAPEPKITRPEPAPSPVAAAPVVARAPEAQTDPGEPGEGEFGEEGDVVQASLPASEQTPEPDRLVPLEPFGPAEAPSELRAPGSAKPGTFRLDYGKDSAGEFAVYRLRAGEALYSSVVVRFTGRLLAADVNALAEEIAARSGIADVTDIPVGYRVKIPLDLLLPEHLPAGHPRRRAWEEQLAQTQRFDNPVQALGLEGVTVILDAGHGGRDTGALFGGVWESTHVYDIMLRVRQVLLDHTSAKVVHTTQDGPRLTPHERDQLPYSRGHQVLTSPPYAIEEATIGTNLRWYLANSVYRQRTEAGVAAEKVIFVSIHADSLHPSVRGAMVYIPDAQLREGSFGKTGAVFQARREVREQPVVQFSWQNRLKSEGLSRDLAGHILRGFKRRDLLVHPEKPIRERIIRRRSQYVPAVLRYNAVPAKVLVEVCNLANDQDRNLLATRSQRQRFAEAIVEGLLTYYGYDGKDFDQRLAAAAGGGGAGR